MIKLTPKKRKKIIEELEDLLQFGQLDGVEKEEDDPSPTITLNNILKILNT